MAVSANLTGERIANLATHGFEQSELMEPLQQLRAEAVVGDQGIITSRNPGDLDAFCAKVAEATLEGRHEKRKVA